MLISCKEEKSIDYAIISGSILNNGNGELIFTNSTNSDLKKVVTINGYGEFIDTLDISTGVYIFYDGSNSTNLYIDKGNNINIHYDANDFRNTLKITGVGSETCNYLQDKIKIEMELLGEGASLYELEESAYKDKVNEVKIALKQLISNSTSLTKVFKKKEEKNINYEYLNKLNIYESCYAHYTKTPNFKTSEGFLNELKDLNYELVEDFWFSPDYKNLVTSYIHKKTAKLVEKDSMDYDIAFIKAATSIDIETIRNSLLYDNSKYSITYSENLEAFYKAFMNASSNIKNNKEITETYNKLKAVTKGNFSPKFIDYENYAGGTLSLDDLKGKYVYIDIWATWCGPCMYEVPYLKDLIKKYHDKNIEFVSISIDDDKYHDNWMKMVKAEKLEGIQLFADKHWKSDFVKNYLILIIPRYILIDPNGIIINPNAQRPSSNELKELLSKLL
jgi:thiol-disulfide isomerase/thioredoxin